MKSQFLSLFLIALSVSAFGGDTIDFARDIEPIFEANCLHCHGEDEQESGFRVDRRVSLLKGGEHGIPAIVPGKPDRSFLLDVIEHRDAELKMPPDEDKLPADEIELIWRWIQSGAVWPGQMDQVVDEKSDHWSFQPVVRPEAPSSIDGFLKRKLDAHDLTFSPPADPRTLIRRVSIVLTGLPPTPSEAADFIDDYQNNADTAYARLVDRLLASPHFGERWAQHWLDVIRWAETNGSEANLYRKGAWRYRDYVIAAFNSDKPYDQFIREQIAGDTLESGVATGFLVAGPHVPAATVGREPSAIRQARADRLDEVIQTVGASMMGVSIGCARCHNHKFDPLSIRDYYSMTAVFQDIEFGGRFPELSDDESRGQRRNKLMDQIEIQRQTLRESGSWQENWGGYVEMHLPEPVTTNRLRISFDKPWLRIDELEIYGPRVGSPNFALASQGTRIEVDPSIENPKTAIVLINDGDFGIFAWSPQVIKGSDKRPWLEVTFEVPQTISRIRMSSNRESCWDSDYIDVETKLSIPDYTVEIPDTDGSGSRQVFRSRDDSKLSPNSAAAKALSELQRLIDALTDEAQQHSYVGRFIEPATTFVLHRGSPENPRDEVPPAGLAELGGDLGLNSDSEGTERRREFADWLTDSNHPLTSRVMVNRLWHHVFGSGIVATTSDFGTAGSPPTHPELLDWLAAEFVSPECPEDAKPWSVKHMLRLMVMSRAFRQSNLPQPQGLAADATAALLWRFPPRRSEAEVLRDATLLASGKLDESIGGIGYRIHNVKKTYAQWEVIDNHGPHTWRRMIYQERMRRVDDQMFTAFDFPDCGQIRAKRPVSTTPLQALNLLNSEFIVEQAALIAQRAKQESEGGSRAAISRCYQLILQREPSATELDECEPIADDSGLAIVCRVLLNSNEFAFLP